MLPLVIDITTRVTSPACVSGLVRHLLPPSYLIHDINVGDADSCLPVGYFSLLTWLPPEYFCLLLARTALLSIRRLRCG